jgi:multiple sugar transport system permease protein
MKAHIRNHATAYLFVSPLLIAVSVFLLYPILKAAIMSFQYWYLTKPVGGNPFVGFQNYYEVIRYDYFTSSVLITIAYIVVTVIARFALGLGVAVLLNQDFKGNSLVRALVIIPWAVPEVVACLVFILMYDHQYGIINEFLMKFHLLTSPVAFLGDSDTALGAAMLVNVWKGFPFVAIMLLAGLQSIPKELYEAAKVDGASTWRQFRYVTLPMLKPVSVIVFLLLVIWTIKDFAIVYVLTGGGPSRATEIFTIFIYNTAFKNFQFGEAAAAGMLVMLVSTVFTILYFKATKGAEN